MADTDNVVAMDTAPAIEALESLIAEFDEAREGAQAMGGGIGEAARGLDDLEAAAGKQARAQRSLSGGFSTVALTSRDAGEKLGKTTDTLGKLTQAGTLAAPAISGLGGQFASAAGLAAELGGAVGPVGIALTGLTLTIGLVIEEMNRQEEAQKRLIAAENAHRVEIAETEAALRSQADAYRALGRAQNIEFRLFEEFATPRERLLEEQRSLQLKIAGTLEDISRIGSEPFLEDSLERDRAKLEEVSQSIASMERQARSSSKSDSEQLQEEIRRRQAVLDDLAGGLEVERIEAEVQAELERDRVREQIAREDVRRHNDASRRREEERQQIEDMMRQAIELEQDLRNERDEAKAKMERAGDATANYLSQGIALYQTMKEISAQQAAGEITAAQARKQRQAAFLQEFSQQMLLQGLEQVAQSVAAIPNPVLVASHAAAAGLFFAAAAATGKAGRKAAAAGGAGGGSSPRASSRDSGGGGGSGSTTVININNPLTSTVDQGREVDRAITAKNKRLGGSGRR